MYKKPFLHRLLEGQIQYPFWEVLHFQAIVPSSQLGNLLTLLQKWFAYQSFLGPLKLKENSSKSRGCPAADSGYERVAGRQPP